MHAAIVKLDLLFYSIWTRPQHNYFLFIARMRFVFFIESTVVIGRMCLKLSSTGIYFFVYPIDSHLISLVKHLTLQAPQQMRNLSVGVPFLFCIKKYFPWKRIQRMFFNFLFEKD